MTDDIVRLHAYIFRIDASALESALARPAPHALHQGTDVAMQGAVFVHGFQKKTQKIPRRELKIAEQRMQGFIRRAEEVSDRRG